MLASGRKERNNGVWALWTRQLIWEQGLDTQPPTPTPTHTHTHAHTQACTHPHTHASHLMK